jgi:hypothetical protein
VQLLIDGADVSTAVTVDNVLRTVWRARIDNAGCSGAWWFGNREHCLLSP